MKHSVLLLFAITAFSCSKKILSTESISKDYTLIREYKNDVRFYKYNCTDTLFNKSAIASLNNYLKSNYSDILELKNTSCHDSINNITYLKLYEETTAKIDVRGKVCMLHEFISGNRTIVLLLVFSVKNFMKYTKIYFKTNSYVEHPIGGIKLKDATNIFDYGDIYVCIQNDSTFSIDKLPH